MVFPLEAILQKVLINEHENSHQHINSALSYDNWVQGNRINIHLESELNSKIDS